MRIFALGDETAFALDESGNALHDPDCGREPRA